MMKPVCLRLLKGKAVLAVALLILVPGCSRPLERAVPTTGTVEAHFMDQRTNGNAVGVTIYLCQAGEGKKCTLRSSLTGTTGADGVLRLNDVPPGRYVVAIVGPKSAGAVEDGRLLDFAATGVFILAGSVVNSDADGSPSVDGALKDAKSDLRVISNRGKLLDLEIRAGQKTDAHVELPAMVLK